MRKLASQVGVLLERIPCSNSVCLCQCIDFHAVLLNAIVYHYLTTNSEDQLSKQQLRHEATFPHPGKDGVFETKVEPSRVLFSIGGIAN